MKNAIIFSSKYFLNILGVKKWFFKKFYIEDKNVLFNL